MILRMILRKRQKELPLEYASFAERVMLKTKKIQNKKIVKWLNYFILYIINATKTEDY
jgi:hypothetical protein